jgi:hypothetical protein
MLKLFVPQLLHVVPNFPSLVNPRASAMPANPAFARCDEFQHYSRGRAVKFAHRPDDRLRKIFSGIK